MGLNKNWWVDRVSSTHVLFGFLGLCVNFAKPLSCMSMFAGYGGQLWSDFLHEGKGGKCQEGL